MPRLHEEEEKGNLMVALLQNSRERHLCSRTSQSVIYILGRDVHQPTPLNLDDVNIIITGLPGSKLSSKNV